MHPLATLHAWYQKHIHTHQESLCVYIHVHTKGAALPGYTLNFARFVWGNTAFSYLHHVPYDVAE